MSIVDTLGETAGNLIEPVAEGIGEAVEPVAPALDFVGLGEEPLFGPTPRDLFGALGQGVRDAVMNSAAGIVPATAGIASAGGDLSTREKLLFGGLLTAGTIGAGRQAYGAWRRTRVPLWSNLTASAAPAKRSLPSGVAELAGLGVRLGDTDDVLDLALHRPGMRGRTARILAAPTPIDQAHELARFTARKPETDPRVLRLRGLLDEYEASHPDPDSAIQDWTIFDALDEGDRISRNQFGKRIKGLFSRALNGEELSTAEWDELSSQLQFTGRALDGFHDDLTIGYTGRLESLLLDGGEPRPLVSIAPIDPTRRVFESPLLRAARLKQLNPRQYAEQGIQNIVETFLAGWDDRSARRLGKPPVLPAALKLGPDWYQDAHNRIWGLARKSDVGRKRLTAIVSLSSAATDWEVNIDLAKRIDDVIVGTKGVKDRDFQAWLRDGVFPDASRKRKDTRWVYAGRTAAQHQALFDRVRADLGDIKVSEKDLKKMLRLAVESPEEVFLSTTGRKQKNFYLNLLQPDLEAPVTVDRHAFDIFWGFDSGVPDRPIDDAIGFSESSYNVISDAYRRAAKELSSQLQLEHELLPNQVQAVAWEAWKIQKAAHDGSWGTGNPWRLPGPDGAESESFRALVGDESVLVPSGITSAPGEILDVLKLPAGSKGLQVFGAGTVVTGVNEAATFHARDLVPTVRDPKTGRQFWTKVAPAELDDWAHLDASLADSHAVVEELPKEFTHWRTRQEAIVYDDEGGPLPAIFGVDDPHTPKPVRIGPINRSGRKMSVARLDPADLTDAATAQQQLDDTAWAIVTDTGSPKTNTEMLEKIRRAGYAPIRLAGEDKAWIVFGPEPNEAARWSKQTVYVNTGEITDVRPKTPDPQVLVDEINKNGGFTYDPRSGKFATTGVAVAQVDSPEAVFDLDDFTREALEEWVEENAVALGRRGAHIGGWVEDDKVYLDVSEVVPRSADGSHMETVVRKMRRANQKAAFDLDALDEVPNPDYVEGGARTVAPWRLKALDGSEIEVVPPREYGSREFDRGELGRPVRYLLPIRPERSHLISRYADDLERSGRKNLVVYSQHSSIGGFEPATEHYYTNGVSTRLVRSRTKVLGEPNAVRVHVRPTQWLPERAPQVAPEGHRLDPNLEFTERQNGTVLIDAGEDLSGAVTNAVNLGHRFGHGNVRIKTPEGELGMHRPQEVTPKQLATTDVVRLGGERTKFASDFSTDAFALDGQVRIQRTLSDRKQLDPRAEAAITTAVESVVSEYPELMDVWQLPGVRFADLGDAGGGFRTFGAIVGKEGYGSAVNLQEFRWANVDTLVKDMENLVAKGHFPKSTAGKTMEATVAHELGHLVHFTVQILQTGKRVMGRPPLLDTGKVGPALNGQIDQDLWQLVQRVGEGRIKRDLSKYAAKNLNELVGEAFAEVYIGGGQSAVAREVVDIVNRNLAPYRQGRWRSAPRRA